MPLPAPPLPPPCRSEHEGLTDDDFNVFTTPEGMLSSEVVPEGVYVPEVVVSKNVRKARGRFKVRWGPLGGVGGGVPVVLGQGIGGWRGRQPAQWDRGFQGVRTSGRGFEAT